MARVLVLSDDPHVQDVAGELLRDQGHEVACAVHVQEVEALLAAAPADLALVDCVLLGEQAEALAMRLSSRFGLHVILMTGDSRRLQVIRDRPLPVLAKPLSRSTLQDMIERMLARGSPGAMAQDLGLVPRGLLRLRAARNLVENYLLRAVGRAFDRYVREYRWKGLRFAIPRELTTIEFRARFLLRRYEIPELTLTRRYLARDATVLELGGCLGVVSCFLNRHLADPRRHVVFEAHPSIIPHLDANRRRNGCNFQIRQQVISTATSATFYLRDPFIAGSSTVRLSGRKIDVPTTSIERLERETALAFDTVVIDIEGGEHAFFGANHDLLRRLRLVIVEMHPHIIGQPACDEIRALFTLAGLQRQDRMGSVEAWARPVPVPIAVPGGLAYVANPSS